MGKARGRASGLAAAGVVAALCASCDSSSPPPPATYRSCAIAPPQPADWRLSAQGTSFVDASGRVVSLRGVDAGGRSKFAPYVPFDFAPGQYASALAAYMNRAASWGVDVLRVPFTWTALEPTQGQDDTNWLSLYDQLLDAAWARGIYTVLDFHQDVYSEVYCGDGFPAWTVSNPPAPHHDCPNWSLEYATDTDVQGAFDRFWASGSSVQAAYLAAWDVMIARYKDRPGVIGFEPINEPGWGSADETTFSSSTLTSFYSMLVAHVRAAAPHSLVFVDPTGLDGAILVTQLGRPAGDGVVFAPHFYPLSKAPDAVPAGLATWAGIGASWDAPVFVGEFGVNDPSEASVPYITAVFDAFDTLGLSGAQWEYSVSADVWNSETFGLVAADGTENPIAKPIQRPYARAVAGTSLAQIYDSSSRVFSLTYVAGSGVTEVALPPGAYTSGYDVTLTGACADMTSSPGRVLLQADAGDAAVSLRIAPKE